MNANLHSQNLVKNGSFEENIGCPGAFVFLTNTVDWFTLPEHSGTADLFWSDCPYNGIGLKNTMARNQFPKEGVGFIGMFSYGSNLREYSCSELKQALEANKIYKVEFWVQPAVGYGTAINAFGLHFSNERPSANNPTSLAPVNFIEHIGNPSSRMIRDTTTWTLISGEYLAMGGERFITLGNFKTDQQTEHASIKEAAIRADRSYILLDQVSVKLATDSAEIIDSPIDLNTQIDQKRTINLVPVEMLTVNKTAKLQLWDQNMEDGDKINLFLNGKVVLEDLVISKKGIIVDLQLEKGKNEIVIEAVNLGKIPPNTVAVKLMNGKTTKRSVLTTSLTVSQQLNIILEED